MDITLPGGVTIVGSKPVVIIGANGSGKTRLAREIQPSAGIEFVNAMRNTRVVAQVPPMRLTDASNNLTNQRSQATSNHWELQNDFELLLSKLQAEHSAAAIAVMDAVRAHRDVPDGLTKMERIRALWGRVFPGRALSLRDNALMVSSTVSGELEYSANSMSDAERAALYLAGKVLDTGSPAILVDEPENHFHSLLAVQLWDVLEQERPDVRFIYITHDLPFALSREEATFVLASPQEKLRVLEVASDLPATVAGALLGAASFSFYAKRVVFCEGDEGSADVRLYRAWFSGRDTVVRPVGSCEMVMRCTTALQQSGIAVGLGAFGFIDRDFWSDSLLSALPEGVRAIGLHEVESIYCIPEVLAAVGAHLGLGLDVNGYIAAVRADFNAAQRDFLILERWKRALEPLLTSLVSNVSAKKDSVETIIAAVPGIFDQGAWQFSPSPMLAREREAVDAVLGSGDVIALLCLIPGKSRLSVAARRIGLQPVAYRNLVNNALDGSNPELRELGEKLRYLIAPYLPTLTNE